MATNQTAERYVWLGKRLKESRLRLGLTAADVHAATVIAANTLTAWEKGRRDELTEAPVAMAQLYGWPEGAIDRVLDGGMPHEDPVEVPTTLRGLSHQNAQALRGRLDGASYLSEAQKRQLLADLLDDPGPTG
jgi:transcriptional regulator with XRE-family HTH domain